MPQRLQKAMAKAMLHRPKTPTSMRGSLEQDDSAHEGPPMMEM